MMTRIVHIAVMRLLATESKSHFMFLGPEAFSWIALHVSCDERGLIVDGQARTVVRRHADKGIEVS
jgi:hypothetical protein